MDAQRIVSFWPEDFVMEFQPGLPFAGQWKGRAEVRAAFEAIVAETRRWRTVHSTDYFANLPGMAEHYGSMEVAARPQERAVVAAA
jgi:hypothetical protein